MAKLLRGTGWLLMFWIVWEAAVALDMWFHLLLALALYFASWGVDAYNEANPPKTKEQILEEVRQDSINYGGDMRDSRLTDWKGSPM